MSRRFFFLYKCKLKIFRLRASTRVLRSLSSPILYRWLFICFFSSLGKHAPHHHRLIIQDTSQSMFSLTLTFTMCEYVVSFRIIKFAELMLTVMNFFLSVLYWMNWIFKISHIFLQINLFSLYKLRARSPIWPKK